MFKFVVLSTIISSWALQLQGNSQEDPEPRELAGARTESGNGANSKSDQCSLGQHVRDEQAQFGRNAHRRGSELSARQVCHSFEATGGLDFVTLVRHDGSKKGKHRHHGHTAKEKTSKTERKTDVADPQPGSQVVWVSGYPRSGSSTVLSMVSGTVDDNREGGEIFSLFEPCHGGDEYSPNLEKGGCGKVLERLASCEFDDIQKLWGWSDPHSTNDHQKFTPDVATSLCQEAQVVAFKTVDYGHDKKERNRFLHKYPTAKVLDVVRDPRGIYASWKNLEPFATLVKSGNYYTIPDVCAHFAANLASENDQVHKIIFEELTQNPVETTWKAYRFMGLPFTATQMDWVSEVFNATSCPEPDPTREGYTDCHVNTADSPVEKDLWRSQLTKDELDSFTKDANCRKVAKAYGYTLED